MTASGRYDSGELSVDDAEESLIMRQSGMRVDPLIGQKLGNGRYEILEVLGYGGMSVVYKACQVQVDRIVAVKALRLQLMMDPTIVKRFDREVKTLSKLSHPNIVTVYDLVVGDDGQAYFVMDYLVGKSLEDLIKDEGALTPSRALKIFVQVCNAVAYAHSLQIIHRDLKPANIMVLDLGGGQDFVKVVDFGLAKLGEDAQRITSTGEIWGSPYYMSPEQCGGEVDERSDIYSMGAVMYETLSGTVPFKGKTFVETISKHVHEPPRRFEEVEPTLHISPTLQAIVLKALAKSPAERYQSMGELRDALMVAEQAGANAMQPPVPPPNTGSQPRITTDITIPKGLTAPTDVAGGAPGQGLIPSSRPAPSVLGYGAGANSASANANSAPAVGAQSAANPQPRTNPQPSTNPNPSVSAQLPRPHVTGPNSGAHDGRTVGPNAFGAGFGADSVDGTNGGSAFSFGLKSEPEPERHRVMTEMESGVRSAPAESRHGAGFVGAGGAAKATGPSASIRAGKSALRPTKPGSSKYVIAGAISLFLGVGALGAVVVKSMAPKAVEDSVLPPSAFEKKENRGVREHKAEAQASEDGHTAENGSTQPKKESQTTPVSQTETPHTEPSQPDTQTADSHQADNGNGSTEAKTGNSSKAPNTVSEEKPPKKKGLLSKLNPIKKHHQKAHSSDSSESGVAAPIEIPHRTESDSDRWERVNKM